METTRPHPHHHHQKLFGISGGFPKQQSEHMFMRVFVCWKASVVKLSKSHHTHTQTQLMMTKSRAKITHWDGGNHKVINYHQPSQCQLIQSHHADLSGLAEIQCNTKFLKTVHIFSQKICLTHLSLSAELLEEDRIIMLYREDYRDKRGQVKIDSEIYNFLAEGE